MMEIFLDEVNQSLEREFDLYFKYIENIGSGSFGTVIRAIYLEQDREVAVKVIDKSCHNFKNVNRLRHEITILQQIKHKNIVEFIGCIETNTKLYIITEYIRDGTLKNLIENMQKAEKKFTEDEASTIMKSLFSAVEHIHRREILHRDIKPENIIFNDYRDLSTLKLIDFGLSSQILESKNSNEFCGTLIYMAPEQLEKRVYTSAIDIWSCGIIMYNLLNIGHHPFFKRGENCDLLIEKLKIGKWMCIDPISSMANHLLKKLLEINTCKRYTADQVLRHPWITRNNFDSIPKNYLETMKYRTLKNKFITFLGSLLFLNEFSKKVEKQNHIDISSNAFEILTKYSDKELIESKDQIMKKKLDVVNYIQKTESISKLMNEAYRNQRESCLSIPEIRTKENNIEEVTLKNFYTRKKSYLKLNKNEQFSTPEKSNETNDSNLKENKKLQIKMTKEPRFIMNNNPNVKYDKSIISNISNQKTQECSPPTGVFRYRPIDSEKRKICLKDMKKSNRNFSISPEVNNKISHTESENSEFRIVLRKIPTVTKLSPIRLKKLNIHQQKETEEKLMGDEVISIRSSLIKNEKNHQKNLSDINISKKFNIIKTEVSKKNMIGKKNLKSVLLPDIMTPLYKKISPNKNLNSTSNAQSNIFNKKKISNKMMKNSQIDLNIKDDFQNPINNILRNSHISFKYLKHPLNLKKQKTLFENI